MNTCPFCASALPERAIFCPACAKPARCKSCRDVLEPDARACVSCGTLVGEGFAAAFSATTPPPTAVNVLQFQEDKGGRSLNFRFTDEAMATVGQTLLYAIDNRLPRAPLSAQRGGAHVTHVPLIQEGNHEQQGQNEQADDQQSEVKPPPVGSDSGTSWGGLPSRRYGLNSRRTASKSRQQTRLREKAVGAFHVCPRASWPCASDALGLEYDFAEGLRSEHSYFLKNPPGVRKGWRDIPIEQTGTR